MKIHVAKSSWTCVFVLCLSFSIPSAGAADAPAVSVAKVLTTSQTSSGQPIVLPQSNVELIVTMLEIQPGAKLPEHLHPYERYAYMLAGALKITNDVTGKSETFKAGDFIVESISQWHHAESVGDVAVKLLVIDQVDSRKAENVVLKK